MRSSEPDASAVTEMIFGVVAAARGLDLPHPVGHAGVLVGEVYALGCLFYHMVWKEPHPWSYVFNSRRLGGMSDSQKEKLHDKIVSLYKKTRNKLVGNLATKEQNQQTLTPFEQLQLTTFDMLHYNPKKRPSIKSLVEKFRSLRPSTNITYSEEELIEYLSAMVD